MNDMDDADDADDADSVSGCKVGHMPATPLRKDAARNRRQILQTARAMLDAGATLQLNAVAREADVGVGTVYRHFPTPEALLAALAEQRFEELIDEVRRATAAPDVRAALRDILEHGLTAYLEDKAFAAEALGPAPTTERTRELRDELAGLLRDLLSRAVSDGVMRPGIDALDLLVLICGIAYAVNHTPHPGDPGVASRYLNALLNGVLIDNGGVAEGAADDGRDISKGHAVSKGHAGDGGRVDEGPAGGGANGAASSRA